MDQNFRRNVLQYLESHKNVRKAINELTYNKKTLQGFIEYNSVTVEVDKSAPGFSGTKTKITDEELVRAYLILKLITELSYPGSAEIIQMKKSINR